MSDETSDPTADLGGPLPPLDPELAEWFASAPAPAMPPEVWDRIEGALAAQPPFTPSGEVPAAAVAAPATVADLSERRERRGRSRALPILAGAAGLVLVGAVVVPAMRGGDAPAPVAEGNGGQPAVIADPNPSPDMVASAPTAAMPRMMMSTGTDYASAQMPDQVQPLLVTAGLTDAASVATMSSLMPTDVAPVGTGGFTASAESLADCMGKLGMAPDGPPTLLIDRATYDGADVGVVVTVRSLPDGAEEPAVLDVVVVGSECSDADVAAAQRFEYAVTP